MELIGKWKVKEVMTLEDTGLVWKTLDELEASENADEDSISFYRNNTMVFNEDGTVETRMPLPGEVTEEMLAEISEAGMTVKDGMMAQVSNRWKEEGGKFLYDTGVEGEIMGESASSWVEIVEVGDMIELPMMRLARVE